MKNDAYYTAEEGPLPHLWLQECCSRLTNGHGIELRQHIQNRIASKSNPERDISFSGADGDPVTYICHPAKTGWFLEALLSIEYKELKDLKKCQPLVSLVMYEKASKKSISFNTKFRIKIA